MQHELVYPWANFDGVHYSAIASRGYIDEGRFMPTLPLLTHIVTLALTFSTTTQPYSVAIFFVGMMVCGVASVLAFTALQRLLLQDFSAKTATQILIWLLAFPTAFIFATLYTEGLFLLWGVLSLWCARNKKWAWASVIVMLAAVTRLAGILLLIPVLYEYYVLEVRSAETARKWYSHTAVVWFLATPLLLLAYMYYNSVLWNDPLYFVNAHAALGNSREVSGLVAPPITVYRYLRMLTTVSPSVYEYWIALLEFVSLIFVCGGVVLAWLQRQRLSYQIYSWVLLALPLLSGTLSGFPRYVLPLFPLFIAYQQAFRTYPKLTKVVLGASLVLQAVLLALFVRGYYVT